MTFKEQLKNPVVWAIIILMILGIGIGVWYRIVDPPCLMEFWC